MPEKAVSLSDVAAAARVSISTASKALSGNGRVSPETRERVAEAAKRLDYQPNALAQYLSKGRSKTIGVLTHGSPGGPSTPILLGATMALGRHEMATLTYDARRDHRRLREQVRSLQARQVDGILVVGDGIEKQVGNISADYSGPVVYTFCSPENATAIEFDHNTRAETPGAPTDSDPSLHAVGAAAAEHLLTLIAGTNGHGINGGGTNGGGNDSAARHRP